MSFVMTDAMRSRVHVELEVVMEILQGAKVEGLIESKELDAHTHNTRTTHIVELLLCIS